MARPRLSFALPRVQALARMLAGDFVIAARNILRQGRRSAVALGAVTGGIVAMLIASGFFEWNFDFMRENSIRSRIGHIQVMKAGYLENGVADPFRYLIDERSPDRARIEGFEGVDVVAPRLGFGGLISIGDATVSFAGEGVDPLKERKASDAILMLQGTDLSAIDAKEVLVGQGLAENLQLKIGDSVVLLTSTASGGVNAVEVRVAGIFATITKAYDDFAIRLPLTTAQELLRVKGVHQWLVLLARTDLTDRVIGPMRDAMTDRSLQLVPWHETSTADFYNKTVKLFSMQVFVVQVMIAVIIVLSISNTMMTNVRERYAEIGTCLALGDTGRVILRRFLAEGVVIGLVGGLLGCVLGWCAAWLITLVGIPMPPPPGVVRSFTAGILVTPALLGQALVLALGTTFVAGLLPAWRASRLPIVDALRHAR
jgi:putative ABC transport system permease protein